jgi:hypothetical protein
LHRQIGTNISLHAGAITDGPTRAPMACLPLRGVVCLHDLHTGELVALAQRHDRHDELSYYKR